jgi:hypothetical protein
VRTTLTINDDVANLLKKEMRQSGDSFKETVNRYLRLGLTASKGQNRKPFVVKPFTLGLPPGMSYDKVSELLEILEGPEHK